MNIFDQYLDKIKNILLDLSKNGNIVLPEKMDGITAEIPPAKFNSDISTNVAMVLSKANKKSPLDLAKILVESIKKNDERNSSNQTSNKKETFLNPADIYLRKLNREEKKKANNYNKGEYLGDVSTGSAYVNILCRDFEYVDGDRVRISVNDSIIIYNLFLESKFAGFKLPLTKGFNKVDFTALNQGSSGPNTAELRVFDDSNQLISSNQWNLSTGATATFIVVKK